MSASSPAISSPAGSDEEPSEHLHGPPTAANVPDDSSDYSDDEDIEVDAMLPVSSVLQLKPRSMDLTQLPADHQTTAQLRSGFNAFIRSRIAPPASKRPRKDLRSQAQRHLHPRPRWCPPSRSSVASPLGNLPVELLTEVFAYTRPTDLTAIALTCSYFRRFLMNDAASPIWRRVRGNTVPATPDPPEGWSEHDFCRLVFGWAQCEICVQVTCRIPISFVLRAKLCKSPLCGKKFAAKLETFPRIDGPGLWFAPILRPLEKQVQDPSSRVRDESLRRLQSAAQQCVYVRKGSVEPTLSRYAADVARLGEAIADGNWLADIGPLETLEKYWNGLVVWASKFEQHERTVSKDNDKFIRHLAKENSWERRDLYNSATIVRLVRTARHEGEFLTTEAVAPLVAQIGAEIQSLGKTRTRRANAAIQTRALAEMVTLHAFLVSSRRHPLPPLHEFKRLPAIQVIVNTGSPRAALDKNTVIANVESHLQHWAERARHDFANLLPRSDAPDARPATIAAAANWIHPAERLDALYLCTRCKADETDDVQQSPFTWRAMTCAAACQHTCAPTRRSNTQSVLGTGRFAWDERASRAAAAALRAIGADASTATKDEVDALDAMFRCSVDGCRITMPFARVALHALRHSELPVDAVTFDVVDNPGPHGPTVSYKSLFDKNGEEVHGKRVTCRHCRASTGCPESIRTHLRDVHGVAHGYAGDEDFCSPPHDAPEASGSADLGSEFAL